MFLLMFKVVIKFFIARNLFKICDLLFFFFLFVQILKYLSSNKTDELRFTLNLELNLHEY